jgi:hypothetical protein
MLIPAYSKSNVWNFLELYISISKRFSVNWLTR